MHIDNVIFLILSKNAYTKFSAGPSVQSLLKNRRYIGEFKYRDIIVPDGIPVIVPQELFNRVQKKMICTQFSGHCHLN